MTTLHNMQPVMGVQIITDGSTLFNNKPVRGVIDATGETFVKGKVVRGVVVTDKPLYEDQLVTGVVVITDTDQQLYNNLPIIPVDGLED